MERLSGTQHFGLLPVSRRAICLPRSSEILVTAPTLGLIQSRGNVGINLLQENLNMFSKQ